MFDSKKKNQGYQMKPVIAAARADFHAALLKAALTTSSSGVPSNADTSSKPSINIACGIIKRLGKEVQADKQAGQTSGKQFEEACSAFLKQSFLPLGHLRPGNWEISRGMHAISRFDQYSHLAQLEKIAASNAEVRVALGNDYLIKPDIVILRHPEEDAVINASALIVADGVCGHSPLRAANSSEPILHASVSCKWTLRSDRAQNARSEALNLVKNRKGRLPHIAVITAEPMPNRIASIALGTGEIDCVYHFALPELQDALGELNYEDAKEQIDVLVSGKRLRDISDLPLDLAM